MSSKILSQEFYFQDTTTVAEKLLGKILCHKNSHGDILRGKIVETEAYLGIKDPAAHTFGGRNTDRVKSMYLDGGHSYIYLIYGMHHCLNFVTRTQGHPEAVLIRALEVDYGEAPIKMFQKGLPTNGPGKLCLHFGLTKKEDGLELWKKKSGLWVEEAPAIPKKNIVETTRIGVAYAGEAANWPLRFYIKDNPYISKK